MLYRARNSKAPSAWIARGRGRYDQGGAVVCPGFDVYRGFVGCKAWADGRPCSYCFLHTTFRTDPELRGGVCWISPSDWWCDRCDTYLSPSRVTPEENCDTCGEPVRMLDEDLTRDAREAVSKWLSLRCGDPYCPAYGDDDCHGTYRACDRRTMVLNAGELADSFSFSPQENPHVGALLDLFSSAKSNPYRHKLLLVSKAPWDAVTAHLRGRAPSPNVILSFSMGNAYEMESGRPMVAERLVTADELAARGWATRIRLDPMVERDDTRAPRRWAAFIAWAYQRWGGRFPELVTLGTLRHRGGKVKLPPEQRRAIYLATIEGLRVDGYRGPIALCKEPAAMWAEVGLTVGPCNCSAEAPGA